MHVTILSFDKTVLNKFSLGTFVPGSKIMKYELYLDLEGVGNVIFEKKILAKDPISTAGALFCMGRGCCAAARCMINPGLHILSERF